MSDLLNANSEMTNLGLVRLLKLQRVVFHNRIEVVGLVHLLLHHLLLRLQCEL
jgi:hypothetical protein